MWLNSPHPEGGVHGTLPLPGVEGVDTVPNEVREEQKLKPGAVLFMAGAGSHVALTAVERSQGPWRTNDPYIFFLIV